MLPDAFVVPRVTVAAVRLPVIFVGPTVCVTLYFVVPSSEVKAKVLLLLKLTLPTVLNVVFDFIVALFANVIVPVAAAELKVVNVLTPLKVVAWQAVSVKVVTLRFLSLAVEKLPALLFTSIIL